MPVTPDPRAATVPTPPPPPAPAPMQPAPVPPPQATLEPAWYVQLKGELASCKGKSNVVFRKICEEAAKLRYCTPGHQWGKVPECVQPEPKQMEN